MTDEGKWLLFRQNIQQVTHDEETQVDTLGSACKASVLCVSFESKLETSNKFYYNSKIFSSINNIFNTPQVNLYVQGHNNCSKGIKQSLYMEKIYMVIRNDCRGFDDLSYTTHLR